MRIGLALSGGGVRGAVHIGVLKALEENGIVPDLISGTSSGSIVASLYSVGYNASEVERIFKEKANYAIVDFDLSQLFRYVKSLMFNMSRKIDGFVKGDRIKKILMDAYHEKGCTSIKQTKIPIAIPAVDINTSKTTMFLSNRSGIENRDDIEYDDDVELCEAVRASFSYPVVFKPCMLKGKRLVDGGVKDNVPISVLKAMGAKKIIAVNLGYAGKANSEIDDVLEIAVQTIDIMAYEASKANLEEANIVLMPEVYDVRFLEVGRIPECIQRGYEYTIKNIPDIKKSLGY